MAREITIHVWCDNCLREDVRTPGEELPPLSLAPGRAPRVVATCGPCRKAVYEPLLELLAERGVDPEQAGAVAPPRAAKSLKHGRPADPARLAEGTVTCPVCDHETHLVAMRSHAYRNHGRTWEQLDGQDCPYACQVPGCGLAWPKSQALTQHMKSHAQDAPQGGQEALEVDA